MEETEANKANYEELGEHIKLLSARAANNMLTPEGLQDLEDYYERALQLRIMQNTTLTEELKAKNEENTKLKKEVSSVQSTAKHILFLIFLTALYLSSLKWPDLLLPIFESIYDCVVYPPVLIVLSIVVARRY